MRRKIASGGVVVVLSCASCLSANERVYQRRSWGEARIIADGTAVTRMRDRIAQLREDDALRRELRTLLNDDATNFLASTPELAGDIREGLGAHATFSWNLTLGSGAPFETAGGLPRPAATLATQCRQDIPKVELDAGVHSEEGTLVMERVAVHDEDRDSAETVSYVHVVNVVRGSRFPFVGVSEGWLLVRLPPFVQRHLEETAAVAPKGPFRVHPLRLDPR